jgi:hypothetical protein
MVILIQLAKQLTLQKSRNEHLMMINAGHTNQCYDINHCCLKPFSAFLRGTFIPRPSFFFSKKDHRIISS